MLTLSYTSIFILLVFIILFAIRKSYSGKDSKKMKRAIFLYFSGLIAWLVYLYFISNEGFIFDKSLPPKFPLLVLFPALIFIFSFLYVKRNSTIFESIPKSWAIYYQSFRIIMEVIILATCTAGIIPIQATFQRYNFEIIFALTAPIMVYLTFVKPILSENILIVWNIIGILFLVIVVNIMISAFFIPEFWGSDTELIDIRFTQLPLLLLPAFMVPSAIFVHLFSIMQILKSKNK